MQHNLNYIKELREYSMRVSDYYLKQGDMQRSAHAAKQANLIQDFLQKKLAQCESASNLDEFSIHQELLDLLTDEVLMHGI